MRLGHAVGRGRERGDGGSVHPQRARVADVWSGHLDRPPGPVDQRVVQRGPGAPDPVEPLGLARPSGAGDRPVHLGDGRSDPRPVVPDRPPSGERLPSDVVTEHGGDGGGEVDRIAPPEQPTQGRSLRRSEQVDEGGQVGGDHLGARRRAPPAPRCRSSPGRPGGRRTRRCGRAGRAWPVSSMPPSTRQPPSAAARAGGVPWPATHTSTSPTAARMAGSAASSTGSPLRGSSSRPRKVIRGRSPPRQRPPTAATAGAGRGRTRGRSRSG